MTHSLILQSAASVRLCCLLYSTRANCAVVVRSLSLWKRAELKPSGCQMYHYFPRPPPLLCRDMSLSPDSIPQHEIADRRRKTLSGSSDSRGVCPCQATGHSEFCARGVSHQLGVEEGSQRGNISFWMWCQVHTLIWIMAENKQHRKGSGSSGHSSAKT